MISSSRDHRSLLFSGCFLELFKVAQNLGKFMKELLGHFLTVNMDGIISHIYYFKPEFVIFNNLLLESFTKCALWRVCNDSSGFFQK